MQHKALARYGSIPDGWTAFGDQILMFGWAVLIGSEHGAISGEACGRGWYEEQLALGYWQ